MRFRGPLFGTPFIPLTLAAAFGGFLAPSAPVEAQLSATDYARAERMLSWHLDPLIAGDLVAPRWMRGGDRFWYRNKTGDGAQFILVDPVRVTRAPLFDHDRLAAVMSEANDSSYEGRKLPFETFEFTDQAESSIRFQAKKKGWICDIRAYTCTVGDTLPSPVPFARSPDGKWEAFVKDHDLWIRPAAGGDSIRLTTDGQEEWAYGESDWGSVSGAGRPQRPILQWSPDSKTIAVQRTDVRGVEKIPLYSSTQVRPKLYYYPYALPGDSILNRFDIHIVEVESKANHPVDVPQQPSIVAGVTGMADSTWVTVKWGSGSDRLYFTHGIRGSKRIQLMEVGLDGRNPKLLAKDSSATWVELMHGARTPPNWAVAHRGEDMVWFSQRDGWAHLYRFGPDGALKNQITSGPFAVDRIHVVDDAADLVYFTAWGGPDAPFPYHRKLYRVGLDGSGLTLLTPEEADHAVSFTPSGRYFVDSWSTLTEPPVTALRRAPDGRVALSLEKADLSRILAAGWTPREVFKVKARDGITDLWGVISKPSDFDSTKSYPVLEYIYPGPQVGSVGSWGFSAAGRGDVRSMAELGFIVVQLDHLGTPWRSKAFHDAYYGNMGDNGIPDHIAGLRQLAATRPWMDLDRVGIWGHSGGGFASTDAILRYPDFYKVAVSSSGNHDQRSYHYGWGEKYQGLVVRDTVKGTDNYLASANYTMAGNLKGKLFLIHGDLDDNVHPAMTLRVADALIKANKSFDLLIVPDRNHGLDEPYVVRRRWDYFVKHLMGVEPPANYEIRRPEGAR
ncbi:MAG: DPP IV N-terminal domain-containing protein [Longimicrobiales bacterium]|nr:DPP IV N-terminal domain-containing protein [Longimicrobiales bacterium]